MLGTCDIYGIAYHSPLDVSSLLPIGVSSTMDPNADAEVLFSEVLQNIPKESTIKSQILFSPVKYLRDLDLKILDHGKSGRISLKTSHFDMLKGLSNGKKRRSPSGVRKATKATGK